MRTLHKFLPVIVSILMIFSILKVKSITVTTDSGKIRGIVQKTRNGDDFYSFRGIRYAQPPIGPLRFQPPQEPKPWDDIFDATNDGPMCPQPWDRDPNEISEDCLVLNIYTKCSNEKKPVLVFIHGGIFGFGSGHSKYTTGPQYLLDHDDIVVVGINHRLGILGFIVTDTKEAPGNLGFKDQVMALKWLNKNIEKFGGDPNLITISGVSAGGISVSLHLVSPMSQGLFHRVIPMSGSFTTRIPALNQRQTKIISDLVGCSNTSSASEIVECLRDIPYQNLIEVNENLKEFGKNPIRKWNFVVEKDFGQERFLTDDPNYLMSSGEFVRVPIMIGVTSTEYATFAHNIIQNETLIKKFNEDFKKVSPICFLYERDTPRSHEISKILKKEYFNDENLSKENFDKLAQLFSDGILRSGLKRFVDRARQYTSVYVYTNSFVGRYSYLYYPEDKPYGMVHTDDLLYLFVTDGPAPMFNHNDPENLMVERLTRIWIDFVKSGVPSNVGNREWYPSNQTYLNWYELSDSTEHRYFLDYLHVWDELFPESN